MNIYEKIRMFHNIYFKNNFFIKKKTYSMDGEDLFIDNFFKNKRGLYVDVGAYHPLELSNTYLLYKRKWEGINIDINSLSIEYFNFLRSSCFFLYLTKFLLILYFSTIFDPSLVH